MPTPTLPVRRYLRCRSCAHQVEVSTDAVFRFAGDARWPQCCGRPMAYATTGGGPADDATPLERPALPWNRDPTGTVTNGAGA